MPNSAIAIGADHGGFADKQKIRDFLLARGYRVLDMGTSSTEAADYPVFAFRVAEAVAQGNASLGVLLCRSGNGMAMAANRVAGVRAGIATSIHLAELARQHNEANVLVLGSDFMDDPAEAVLEAFLNAKPDDGRHARRVSMIKQHDRMAVSSHPMHQLAARGQSPWLDDISDMLIKSGELKRLIEVEGIRGLTSNPSIFEKAINSGEGRYRAELAKLKAAKATADAAYEKLTTEDIAAAADLLRPLYDETGGDDGFVSLEVLPNLAYEEEKTVSEALRLFKLLDRPNIMIKVPGTKEGIRAFRRLTAAGVNINVTLIFSRAYYNDIARAYIDGLKERHAAGKDISRVRSVASVFVSRIDAAAGKLLAKIVESDPDASRKAAASSLLNAVAIANTRLIYADFKKLFHGDAFAALAAAGAAPQRPLWGSTGTKDPKLSDVLYVEELIGPQTVNTIPMATAKAFIDHGKVRGNTVEEDLPGAQARIEQLEKLGISLEAICDDLQKAGVVLFAEAFEKLFAAIKSSLA